MSGYYGAPYRGSERRVVPYRRHGKRDCTAAHRTYRTWARCLWPHAHWIIGDGPFATVSRCRYRVLTVQLHRSEQDARVALGFIDGSGCGGACQGRHDLVKIAVKL